MGRTPMDTEEEFLPLFLAGPSREFRRFRLRIVKECQSNESHIDWIVSAAAHDCDRDDNPGDSDGDEADSKSSSLELVKGVEIIGIQVAFTKSAGLAALAICKGDRVLVVTEIQKSSKRASAFRTAFQSKLLEGTFYFTAFDAHEVALTVYKDTSLRLSRLFNILDFPNPSAKPSHVATTTKAFADADVEIFEDHIRNAFIKREFNGGYKTDHARDLAQEVWLAHMVGRKLYQEKQLLPISPINLMKLDETVCSDLCLGSLIRSDRQLRVWTAW